MYAIAKESPELLLEYMLGDVHAGPGLLRRVATKVSQLSEDPGPAFNTSSILSIGHITPGSEESTDDGDIPRVLELAATLVHWRDTGVPTAPSDDRDGLIKKLRSWRITDADFLLSERNRRAPLLRQVRDDVAALLTREPPKVDTVLLLAGALRGWMGGACAHDFRPLPSEDSDIVVMGCECRVRYATDRKGSGRLAV